MLEKQYTAWRTGEWDGCGPHHFYSGNASVRREHLSPSAGLMSSSRVRKMSSWRFVWKSSAACTFVYEPDARGHAPASAPLCVLACRAVCVWAA